MTESTQLSRIAVAQLRMRWTCEENTAAIVAALGIARHRGASVCVFPELSVTGFHKQIRRESERARARHHLDHIRKACATHAVAAVVGTPTHSESADIFNSHVYIDDGGEILTEVRKNGLTPSEAGFFTRGRGRPLAKLNGTVCTSVMCREIEDLDDVTSQLRPHAARIVFWPSLVGRPPSLEPGPEHVDYLPMAQRLAKQLGVHVVQCNWPNALNTPQSRYLGESAVIGPDGEVQFRLPRDEAGVAAFTLGRTDYDWHPEPGTEMSA